MWSRVRVNEQPTRVRSAGSVPSAARPHTSSMEGCQSDPTPLVLEGRAAPDKGNTYGTEMKPTRTTIVVAKQDRWESRSKKIPGNLASNLSEGEIF